MKVQGLVAFDLDGTLIDIGSAWAWVHQRLNTLHEAETNAKLYQAGKINYTQWAEMDVKLWEGVYLSHLQQTIKEIPYKPGAQELITQIKEIGLKTVIISAGLSLFADRSCSELGIDVSYANRLTTDQDGRISGVEVNVANTNKDQILNAVAEEFHISLLNTLAIGDGRSDIPMFNVAGTSIALNPQSEDVSKAATLVVHCKNILELLPYIQNFVKELQNV
ncbi:MAG: HAD family hydrolase [Candidatus Ranarchaeia archaeon]